MYSILSVLVEAGTDMSLCGRFTPIFSACTIGKIQTTTIQQNEKLYQFWTMGIRVELKEKWRLLSVD